VRVLISARHSNSPLTPPSVADFKSLVQFLAFYGTAGKGIKAIVTDAEAEDDEGSRAILLDDFVEDLRE